MAAEPLFMVQETPNVGTSLLFPHPHPQPQLYPWGTYPTHFSNLVTHLPSQQGNGVDDIKINTAAEYPTFIPREMDHPMDAVCSVCPCIWTRLHLTFLPLLTVSTLHLESPEELLLLKELVEGPLHLPLQGRHSQAWPITRETVLQKHIVCVSGRPRRLGLRGSSRFKLWGGILSLSRFLSPSGMLTSTLEVAGVFDGTQGMHFSPWRSLRVKEVLMGSWLLFLSLLLSERQVPTHSWGQA